MDPEIGKNPETARLMIEVDVVADTLNEDPYEVASELLDHAIDQAARYTDARRVVFVGAEWWSP